MKKSIRSVVVSSLALALIGSAPASATTTSVINGDFELGANGATSIDGWTTVNSRIDLGVSNIAGCTTEDTSDYSNLREYFYHSLLNKYGEDGFVTVESIGDTRYRNFLTDPDDESSFALVGGLPVGFERVPVVGEVDSDGDPVYTYRAYLELDSQTTPRTRVFEESWTPSQRLSVLALVRDPVASNDSLQIDWESPQPVFNVGLRPNSSAGDTFVESWQVFEPTFVSDSQFIELYSDMDGAFGPNDLGYVVHGPAIFSEEFTAKTIDDISLKFAASNRSDDYKVFGYLLNTATCEQTEVIDTTGQFSLWQTVTAAVPTNGTYRFVFVSGTYDKTWGTVAGAVMFVDDVVLSPNAERVAEASAAVSNTAASSNATLAATGSSGYLNLLAGLFLTLAGISIYSGSIAVRKKRS